MVTGDQLLIGKETAKQLGMGTNMYTTEVHPCGAAPPSSSVVAHTPWPSAVHVGPCASVALCCVCL